MVPWHLGTVVVHHGQSQTNNDQFETCQNEKPQVDSPHLKTYIKRSCSLAVRKIILLTSNVTWFVNRGSVTEKEVKVKRFDFALGVQPKYVMRTTTESL